MNNKKNFDLRTQKGSRDSRNPKGISKEKLIAYKVESELKKKSTKLVKKLGLKIFKVTAKRVLKHENKKEISKRDIYKIGYCEDVLYGIKIKNDDIIERGLRGLKWLK